jgi:hypothetical protein
MPQPIIEPVASNLDRLVVIEDTRARIAILPIGKKYRLTELLDEFTPELIGGASNWGEPVGRAGW